MKKELGNSFINISNKTKFKLLIALLVLCFTCINKLIFSTGSLKDTNLSFIDNDDDDNDIYSFKLNPKTRICGNDYGKDVLFISFNPSSIQNYENRIAIRNTWSNKFLFKNIRNVFIVGLSLNKSLNAKLLEENNQYGDIVQVNFLDSYQNLTHKTIAGIKWTSQYCYNSKFVVKVDDDVVINTYSFIDYLNFLTKNNTISIKNSLFGYIFDKPYVIRDKNSKFYISKEEYQPDIFSLYCTGSCYIITGDLMKPMFKLTKHIKAFKFEDVYVGMLAKELNSSLNHIGYKYLYNKQNTIKSATAYNLDSFYFGLVDSLKSFYTVWNIIVSKTLK